MRKITVNGLEYKWMVGKSNVLVRTPEGKSYHTPISTLSTLVEGNDEGYEDTYVVFPKQVSEYIKNKILV